MAKKHIFENPLQKLDKFLDKLTSYRLVLYFLYVLSGWAVLMAAAGQISFKWYDIVVSVAWLILVCRAAGELFSRLFNIARNRESDYITALILSLILSPAASWTDYAVLAVAGSVAIASKYLLAINGRHIFNPAAAGAFIVGRLLHHYPSWWVGTKVITPILVIGALLVLRKIKRFIIVGVFLALYLLILAVDIVQRQGSSFVIHNLWLVLIASPAVFFASIMLTEPLTSPSRLRNYLIYGSLVALLYGITSLHLPPEEALLIGNLLAFGLEPTRRYSLSFIKKQKEAEGIYSFLFKSPKKPRYKAGQYMEWTLPVRQTDSRGNRRYLTVASAPSEDEIRISLRIPSPSSSFKQSLNQLAPGDKILASHTAGSFTLPKDTQTKIVMLAGGIGVTPFRSMVKDLLERGESRPVTLLYAASSPAEFAFTKLFSKAQAAGLKAHYVVIDKQNAAGWQGHSGAFNSQLVKDLVPDYKDQRFYLSGPYGFVQTAKAALTELGLKHGQVVVDYFPGYG